MVYFEEYDTCRNFSSEQFQIGPCGRRPVSFRLLKQHKFVDRVVNEFQLWLFNRHHTTKYECCEEECYLIFLKGVELNISSYFTNNKYWV